MLPNARRLLKLADPTPASPASPCLSHGRHNGGSWRHLPLYPPLSPCLLTDLLFPCASLTSRKSVGIKKCLPLWQTFPCLCILSYPNETSPAHSTAVIHGIQWEKTSQLLRNTVAQRNEAKVIVTYSPLRKDIASWTKQCPPRQIHSFLDRMLSVASNRKWVEIVQREGGFPGTYCSGNCASLWFFGLFVSPLCTFWDPEDLFILMW